MTTVPGRKPVAELLASQPELVETVVVERGGRHPDLNAILDRCREAGIPFRAVPKEALDRLCPTGGHQGIVARLLPAPGASLTDLLGQMDQAALPLLVALDEVTDTQNVGALARTLYALGAVGLILPQHRSAALGGSAMKASAGALAKLPIARVPNLGHALDSCEEAGLTIIGAAQGQKAQNAFEMNWPLPAVLVLGAEDKGIRASNLKRCSQLAHIPFARSFDSLNVAQAGGILAALAAKEWTGRSRD